MSIYDFTVKDQQGNDVSLSDYKGKVLLVVNTATECGFTPQYADLQKIYDEFHDQGLEILDFPCNQFGNQAPGSNDDIHTFCTGRFGITFPQFDKIDVNGDDTAPLYRWLKDHSTFEGLGNGPMSLVLKPIVKKMDPDYKNNSNIKWNFTKFLINRDGALVARFEPTKKMAQVREAVQAAIEQ
ncbi:MAG: glutathione peroxidase [Peptococcaceae bacterium]|nr:glutathione peroxidase [Peptococcaceae bacterium]